MDVEPTNGQAASPSYQGFRPLRSQECEEQKIKTITLSGHGANQVKAGKPAQNAQNAKSGLGA